MASSSRYAQPFASWSLSAQNVWTGPIAYPTVTTYISDDGLSTERVYRIRWNEAGQKWTAIKHSDQTNWNWDSSGLAWVSV